MVMVGDEKECASHVPRAGVPWTRMRQTIVVHNSS